MCFPLNVAQHLESFKMGMHPAARLIHDLQFTYSAGDLELIVTSERIRFVRDPEAIVTRRCRHRRGQRADPAHRRSFNIALLGDHYQAHSDNRSNLLMGRVFTDEEEELARFPEIEEIN